MSEVVVDASAILALLNQEKRSEEVARFMGKAAISSVKVSEVIAKLAELNIPEDVIAEILSNLKLEVIPFSEEQALQAGMLRPVTKSLGLSLDRACLALGIYLHKPVLTSDRQWSHLNLNVEVRLVRS
ncbi:type II toxin-antitoxin system VapC family toxin [Roseofilum reptotaenium CS-1145]|uniref:VapC toxin family PIN domain ribonuclease n=1 Tax=Roseofilum reptotaenium AO1-A TaxID=1925591 RepID=A0A1L9QL38_9CYAN|nr:type II toxin-antitoxin system VapC family toxin [Roseofilum reptotaenium]MDB9517187.1 type II toxin-antitoxin system VapC family toxin [Roseofilum reptotaenium CS-1145]OJJ18410.1 VapC toxin family PIN domain ribonuclease [Roseofilum reptotaenium AO1-A]